MVNVHFCGWLVLPGMFILLNTDAPIYHRLRATLALIVTNIAAFLATGCGAVNAEALWQDWLLEYGKGLRPVEWLSSNFRHFGLMHVLDNIIFL